MTRDDIMNVSVSTILILMCVIVVVGQMKGCWTIDETPVPYWPDTPQPLDTAVYETENMVYWEWDSYMDSVDMDCGE